MKNHLLVLASVAIPGILSAQIRASELGTVSQTIDGTRISLEYSRPRARGRDPIFGTKAVHWNETWTPGANWATTLDVSRSVKIAGRPVAKGKYSVWMVVRENTNWTVVLEPDARRFHMEPPDSSAKQIRIPVHAEAVPFTDVLTWSFPDLRMNGGTLAMQWERARVAMNVEVEPSLTMTFPAGEAAAYAGRYTYVEKDSVGKDLAPKVFTISHEDGTLKGQFTPNDPYFKKFALVRIAPDMFTPGIYDKTGQIYEVLKPDMVLEFTRGGGKMATFTVRGADDKLYATGTHKE
ncbi:MAG: DUF2911 domain-containing protein [Gemmatimonadaceae bacterium]